MTKSTTRIKADVANIAGRKNLIINGGFDVWQRGTSSTTDNAYATADRWFKYASGNASTWGKGVDGELGNYVYVPTNSATGYCNIRQRVEGFHVPTSGQLYTLSVWMRTTSGTAPYRLEVWNLVNNNEIYGENNIGTITTAWQRFTTTFAMDAGDSFDNIHLMMGTNTASSSTAEVHFAQVQLEIGSVATDFEHRSYGEELALCQRYYQVLVSGDDNYWASGHYYAAGLFALTFSFPSTMRTTPTAGYTTGVNWYLIYTRGGADPIDGINFMRLHPSGGGADITAGASGVQGSGGTIKTNNPACKIYFDAEIY